MSLVDEVETLHQFFSESWMNTNDQLFQVLTLENCIKQEEIKHDLEVSHIKTKLKVSMNVKSTL